MTNEQIYHLYPLGFTGANQEVNDGKQVLTIGSIGETIDHMKSMNITTLLLGPLFESETHGYDTVDYDQVDRRLGSNDELQSLVSRCHDAGIKVMLDCVFNHVARSHFIFKDILQHREHSKYIFWLSNVNFNQDNWHNDGFTYDNWDGHDHLVKLNLENEDMAEYLYTRALNWVDRYDIDGLRMDAADVMSHKFLRTLSQRLKEKKKSFSLLGEVVHGDYNLWIKEGKLDAITNYEAYKGLYSSLNDANYYEIAYTLKRQFATGGIYPQSAMVNFVDNHDVNRAASVLHNEIHLYPLYIMLYTMPGVPTLYYGSEFGKKGTKASNTDSPLRPSWQEIQHKKDDTLKNTIAKLAYIHKETEAIQKGDYEQVHVDHKTIGYKRHWQGQEVYVFINADNEEANLENIQLKGDFYDLLNEVDLNLQGQLKVHKNWGSILIKK